MILFVESLRKLVIFGTVFLALSLFACKQSPQGDKRSPEAENESRLKVVTTIAPLYSFTKNIAGDSVILENLLPSGVGPHEYSLSPEDARKIADADILIKNGVGLEEWMNKLIGSVNEVRGDSEKLLVVDTSKGVDIIDNDPHIWLSPRNAAIQVRNIEKALRKSDPGNEKLYAKNAADYISRLEELDREIAESVNKWEVKEFVTFHSAFSYFAMDYGLKQSAVIEGSPEAHPSPRHIAEIMDNIRRSGIDVIFSEPDASHKIMDSIAGDLGLRMYSLDTLGTGDLGPGWYISRMRENLETLNNALGAKWTR
jgi:ABC-type Zn uptake system ZnuABC Zn-binding protein ZnuA